VSPDYDQDYFWRITMKKSLLVMLVFLGLSGLAIAADDHSFACKAS
jgi:hypothetical protein